jgi:hypothetical protein
MTIDIVDLIDDLSNVMILIAEVFNLIEEILNLFFLDFKFTIFNVKIEDLPDVFWAKLREVGNFVLGDEGNVELVYTDHLEDFEYLIIVILSSLNTSLVVSCIILLPNDSVNPLSLTAQDIF